MITAPAATSFTIGATNINPMSAVLVAILFAFALWQTRKNYLEEKDPAKKKQIIIQVVLVIVLLVLFTVGLLLIFPTE